MDGFHLDNAILQARDQLPVKGAPQTFDVAGLHSLLLRLAEPRLASRIEADHNVNTIYVPVFDRTADLARNAAQAVEAHHQILIIEGNYLLLNEAPWNALRSLFDLTR